MFQISSGNRRGFEAAATQAFEDDMVRHLGSYSPSHSRAVPVDAIRAAIRVGTQAAAAYHFTLRDPVRLYLELMFLMGSHFDSDPQLDWAGSLLRRADTGTQLSIADRLQVRAARWYQTVVGPHNEYAIRARARCLELRWDDLPQEGPAVETAALEKVAAIYPEKFAASGHEAMTRLAAIARGASRRWGLGRHGAAVVTGLMFMFGHGCDADPLYPWIRATLSEPADPNERCERLFARALAFGNVARRRG